MRTVDQDVDRYLTLLRDRIRERGFTQLGVQEALGWGRSYISQLMTKQKKIRIEQVLLILSVIGIEPAEFFADLHMFRPRSVSRLAQPPQPGIDRALDQLRHEVQRVTELLLDRKLITAEDLSAAVEAASTKGGSES